MYTKNISYFTQNPSTSETIKILDCGYHETLHGRSSAQTIIDHYVLHFVVSGKGTYTVHNETWHLQKNDCFILLPNIPIHYQSDEHDPWIYYWVGFDGVDALQLMQLCNISYQCPVFHYEPVSELTVLVHPLTTLNTSSVSDSYFALGRFYLLCSMMMKRNSHIKPLSRKKYYVNQAISIIENSYYREDVSVKSICDTVGLDRTYLYRIFKEITGETIQQRIAKLRLKRARYFLSSSDLDYSEVAYYCGYASEQYFSMAFKKSCGISPSAYRKRHAKTDINESFKNLSAPKSFSKNKVEKPNSAPLHPQD